MSIPLLRQVYNGQGNTAYSTRRALLDCFHRWIDRKPDQHIWWVADREYADHRLKPGSTGKGWFRELSA
jgi:hypothetical protein